VLASDRHRRSRANGCSATLNADDTVTLTWDQIAGENNYSVRRNGSWLTQAGNTLTYTDNPNPGSYDYTCSATLNADDTVTLTWDPIAGENNYSVRRNGAWLENTGELTFTDVFAEQGDSYVIRSRQDGVSTNTDCR